MSRIWDISPPLRADSPVFPGDTPYSQRWHAQFGEKCPVNVATLTFTAHLGAHADAPLHYSADGATAGALDLTPYLGPCRVIHAIGCGPLIRWEHLAGFTKSLPPRVLVRTCERAPVDRWDPGFTAFAPETLEKLADLGVKLVGLDTASIDPATSKTLDSHRVALRRDLRILENLVLDAVPAGDYELIALPLKLMTADASPVRAVLRSLT
jgi:arylformamidase